MTPRLVIALETALAGMVQRVDREASVLVQFAAGHFHELREALAEARAKLDGEAPQPAPVLESADAHKAGIVLTEAPAGTAPAPEAPAVVNVSDSGASVAGTTVPGEQPPVA
jgi:hypothetical protein